MLEKDELDAEEVVEFELEEAALVDSEEDELVIEEASTVEESGVGEETL